MGTYTTDMRDIRFVLFEMLKIDELAKTERFKDFGKDDYEAFATEAYRFAREVLAPINEIGDRQGVRHENGVVTLPDPFVVAYKRFQEAGWVSAIQNPADGGQGLPWLISQAIHEFFIGACVSFTLTTGLSEGLLGIITEFGSDAVKQRFVPGLMDARWTGTMCLTEAGAGSDVGANKATAVLLDNGRYAIKGEKIFITGGDHNLSDNIVHGVLARVEGAPAGTKGLSLFLVPKFRVNDDGTLGQANDVKVGRIEHKLGIKGSPTCVMVFGDGDACEGYLLGNENDGMKIMFHMMNEARIMVGVQGLAIASSAYQSALAYARERLQGPDLTQMKDPKAPRVPIIRHPDVRRMLMWQKSVTEALRGMLYATAWYADQSAAHADPAEREKFKGFLDLLTPVCKAYGSDMGCRCVDLGLQTLGGYGYVDEYPIEQHYRDARIAPIYEGTNGIQALDLVGRKLGMKGGAVLMSYLKEISSFVDRTKGHPNIGKWVVKLGEAKNLVADQSMRFATVGMQDPTIPALYASAYLESFGDMACAFYLLQAALIADQALTRLYAEAKAVTVTDKKKLVADNPEAKFYHGKLMSTQFFVHHVLPNVKTRVEIFRSGDRTPLDCEF